MRFVDTATNGEHRFSIGRELASGRYYLSIPVSNRMAEMSAAVKSPGRWGSDWEVVAGAMGS